MRFSLGEMFIILEALKNSLVERDDYVWFSSPEERKELVEKMSNMPAKTMSVHREDEASKTIDDLAKLPGIEQAARAKENGRICLDCGQIVPEGRTICQCGRVVPKT